MPFPLFIPGNSKITKFNRKKILQHQKFVESFSRTFWVHPDPFISDDVCFSASFWWGFEKCSINWGNVNCNPDHGSFPVAEYECLWPRVSCVKAKVGFETNVNTSLFKDSLKNLGDPTVVREHNKFLSAEARGAWLLVWFGVRDEVMAVAIDQASVPGKPINLSSD